MRALDALDELEAAAVKLVRAELAAGPVLDGLVADPLTEGTRLDLLCLVDTMAVDLLAVLGRVNMVRHLVAEAPPGSARNALAEHLTRSCPVSGLRLSASASAVGCGDGPGEVFDRLGTRKGKQAGRR